VIFFQQNLSLLNKRFKNKIELIRLFLWKNSPNFQYEKIEKANPDAKAIC
jgi:hypothetical protein